MAKEEEMEKDIGEIKVMLTRLAYILEDDVKTGKKGIVHQLSDYNNRLSNVELSLAKKDVRTATIGGVLGGVGAGVAFLIKLIINAFV